MLLRRRFLFLSLVIVIFLVIWIFANWLGSSRPEEVPPGPTATTGVKPPPPLAPPRFIDVTREAGIGFRHWNGRKGMATILETTGPGCALCDYDGDGWLDIYLLNSSDLYGRDLPDRPRNALYRSRRDGTYEDVTDEAGVACPVYSNGCVFGDYDNDGDADLYVTNYGPNVLYRNEGDGTFLEVTELAGVGDPGWGMSAAFADYDTDGDLDLYITNYLQFDPQTSVRYCKIGVDAQGEVVLSACSPAHYAGSADLLYRNEGDGTFVDVTREAGVLRPDGRGLIAMFADYDDNGQPDLFVGNDDMRDLLFRNLGDGTFKEEAGLAGIDYDLDLDPIASMGIDLADYDGDGRLDLFISNYQDVSNNLWRNTGDGLFENATVTSGLGRSSLEFLAFGMQFIDYDNDGWVDIFVANGHVYPEVELVRDKPETYLQRNQLFRNLGDGTFREVDGGPGTSIALASRGAAFGDIDNDGDVDILVTNNDDPPSLLRNEGGNARNGLLLEFVGRISNRNGLGVRATLHQGEHRQARETKSGGSYLSHSDTRLHFGLGDDLKVETLVIRWPSGREQVFRDLAANGWYVITEGEAEPRLRQMLR